MSPENVLTADAKGDQAIAICDGGSTNTDGRKLEEIDEKEEGEHCGGRQLVDDSADDVDPDNGELSEPDDVQETHDCDPPCWRCEGADAWSQSAVAISLTFSAAASRGQPQLRDGSSRSAPRGRGSSRLHRSKNKNVGANR